ncbi:DUF4143 domain-containing protein [Bifidobacterium ruminantium]|uniref:DUF4143 domain-containing protein n=2 Tax=Bifidobacterium TaxID=1678 RepID=A0A087CY67_BIFRU|nr:DUF4143 domain-containing protein [Bifidobacterium ruminantium]KFI88217.1 hypothetical protein BRUM_2006 [Bifidobacterium ruminantium]
MSGLCEVAHLPWSFTLRRHEQGEEPVVHQRARASLARALPDIGMEPLRYYHDDSGLECDAIIELADGRWAGIEIKSSQDKVEQAAANLNRMKAKLLKNPQARAKAPEFLAVLIGVGEFAYQREDGIYVIPVRALGV